MFILTQVLGGKRREFNFNQVYITDFIKVKDTKSFIDIISSSFLGREVKLDFHQYEASTDKIRCYSANKEFFFHMKEEPITEAAVNKLTESQLYDIISPYGNSKVQVAKNTEINLYVSDRINVSIGSSLIGIKALFDILENPVNSIINIYISKYNAADYELYKKIISVIQNKKDEESDYLSAVTIWLIALELYQSYFKKSE